jgi:hypothetical protein
MSDAPEKLSLSWHDAAASNGFGGLCLRVVEGERFTFVLTDEAKAREHGFRAVEALLLEHELRAQLAQAGFADPVIETGIHVVRLWATTMTRRREGG